ncbi:GHR protein, partial [Amia calva]|nr:GHR protein [Amia calva]
MLFLCTCVYVCVFSPLTVEPDPPFNLTHWFVNSSQEGSGQTVVLSWHYPTTADVQVGWLTLVYEVQFRRSTEPNNWKVKGILREQRLEVLDLPAGSYIFQVRCKSRNSGLWSQWSSPLTVTVPPTQGIDKMLSLILVSVVGIMAFLIIAFGVIPRRKRIKAFLLPPIPKPRIRGIDPMLLKKGKMDEIDRLFTSFHGYNPPEYKEEAWFEVSTDEGLSFKDSPLAKMVKEERERTPSLQPQNQPFLVVGAKEEQMLLHKLEGSSSIEAGQGSLSKEEPSPLNPNDTPNWSRQTQVAMEKSFETITNPMGYSITLSPTKTLKASQDFYTCVNTVNNNGTIQLVPCFPDHGQKSPYLELRDASGNADKAKQQELKNIADKNNQMQSKPKPHNLASNKLKVGAAEERESYTTVESLHLQQGLFACSVSPEEKSLYKFNHCNDYLCIEQNELAVPLLPAPIMKKI